MRYFGGAEGVHYGNVPVENNANCFFCFIRLTGLFLFMALEVTPQKCKNIPELLSMIVAKPIGQTIRQRKTFPITAHHQ